MPLLSILEQTCAIQIAGKYWKARGYAGKVPRSSGGKSALTDKKCSFSLPDLGYSRLDIATPSLVMSKLSGADFSFPVLCLL